MRATGPRPWCRWPAIQQRGCCLMMSSLVLLLLALAMIASVDPEVSGTWTKYDFSPGALISSAAVYCEGMQQVVVVGGAALSMHTGRFHATDRVWVLGKDNQWSKLSPVSGSLTPRLGHSLTVLEDTEDFCDFLVYGAHGSTDATQAAVVGRLSREDQSGHLQVAWGGDDALTIQTSNDTGGPGMRERHTAVAHGSDVYLLGGFTRQVFEDNALWRLSLEKTGRESSSTAGTVDVVPTPRKGTWSAVWKEGSPNATKGPQRAWDLSSVRIGDDHLVFVGGEMWVSADEPATSGDVWIWSVAEQTWQPSHFDRASSSFARSSAVAVALGQDLFIHGGTQISSFRRQKVDYHKSSLLQTQPLAKDPLSRCASDGLTDAGFFYCEPGDENIVGAEPECRSRHTGVVRGDSLLIFGGLSGQECLGVSYVFSDLWEINLARVLRGSFVPAQDSIADITFAYVSSMYFFLALVFVTVLLFASLVFRRRQLATFTYAATDDGSRARGASMTVIRNLPMIKFMDTGRDEDEVCPICLSDYEPEDELLQLPCGHMFHPECGETWLVKNDSCPLCKRALGARDIDESTPVSRADDSDRDASESAAGGRRGEEQGIELQELEVDDVESPFASSFSPARQGQQGSHQQGSPASDDHSDDGQRQERRREQYQVSLV